MSKIEKAYAITDAKISFVSLVDKAANKKQFLITKAEHGSASFASYGRIVNADADSHYITGIVYEPLTEDAHGNYMTEQEITKAAYWFAKNGNQVDVQHSFEPLEKAAVVESYVAPCDMSVGEQAIKKGTWMMTVEVDDTDIFEKVQKGEITGFSMGGVGKYSDEDDPLPDDGVAKAEEQPEKGMRGIFKKMAAALGFDVVEKGEVADNYTKRIQSDNFWTAFYALNDVLYRYNWENDHWEFASDEETVRNALNDFNNIVTELLTKGQPVTKSLESCAVIKAGKAMSKANRSTLQSIYTNLGEFLDKFPEEEQEETEVTMKEIEDTVAAAVAKALETQQKPATDPVQKAAEPAAEPAGLTVEAVGKMVEEAVAKALGQQEEPEKTPELLTAENVADVVAKAVAKAVAPVRKAAGLPTNLNDDGDPEDPVEKSEPHYLAGIL